MKLDNSDEMLSSTTATAYTTRVPDNSQPPAPVPAPVAHTAQQRQSQQHRGEGSPPPPPLAPPQQAEKEKEKEIDIESTGQQQQNDTDKEPNLDSGYAWVILVVMFLFACTTSGSSRLYGLVYAKQVAIGYYDHQDASWPIATASTVENLAGILTPALAQFMSWRQLELLSTALFILSNLGAYYSSSLAVDILCLGVVQGLALSINTVLMLTINNDYFQRYRSTAYGISLTGSTCGVLYLGPLISWVLEAYDNFRVAYLAIGATFVLNLVLSMFLVPRAGKSATTKRNSRLPTPEQERPHHHRAIDLARLERKNSVASINLQCRTRRQSTLSRSSLKWRHNNSHAACSPPSQRQQRRPLTAVQSHPLNWMAEKWSTDGTTATANTATSAAAETTTANKQQSISQLARQNSAAAVLHKQAAAKAANEIAVPLQPLVVTSISAKVSAHSMINSPVSHTPDSATSGRMFKVRSGGAIAAQLRKISLAGRKSTTTNSELLSETVDNDNDNDNRLVFSSNENTEESKFANYKKDTVDVETNNNAEVNEAESSGGQEEEDSGVFSLKSVMELIKAPYLHCVWYMLTLYYLVSRIFIIILADFADDHGLSQDESRSLLNYWSLGEIFGRIVLCSFVDLQWLGLKSCIVLTCSSLAASIALMTAYESYYLYATCSALIAALASLECVLINVLIIEYLGKDKVTSCYSVGAFISSLLLFGRPAMIGLFRDTLGSYHGLLFLLAALCLAFGLMFALFEPLFVRLWPKYKEPPAATSTQRPSNTK